MRFFRSCAPAHWLLLAASGVLFGCQAAPTAPPLVVAPPPAKSAVKLTYRTSADRLIVAPGTTQLASYDPAAVQSLPGGTTLTLNIASPHPRGIPGLALATITVKADVAKPATAPAVWQWISGKPADEPAATGPMEVWAMDIPEWQVDAIVAKLQTARFFQRSQVLSPEVFLAAEVGQKKSGKDYKAMPELDALILRSRQQGRLIAGGGLTQYPPSYPNVVNGFPQLAGAAVPATPATPGVTPAAF